MKRMNLSVLMWTLWQQLLKIRDLSMNYRALAGMLRLQLFSPDRQTELLPVQPLSRSVSIQAGSSQTDTLMLHRPLLSQREVTLQVLRILQAKMLQLRMAQQVWISQTA